jgi:N,N'-diacetyllegionaminate synthase
MKVIAEIGWNFMGDMNLAKKMIEKAQQSGADIVKFQYWDPKYLSTGDWDNDGRREIYNKAALDKHKIEFLRSECLKSNVGCLFSVFNLSGARLMKSIGEHSIKIPSHEVANYKLVQYAITNFNKIYISTGACTESELKKVVEIIKTDGCENNVCLMHCVSSYPVNETDANLKRILYLSQFGMEVGYSDHTQSVVVPALSVAYGSTVIEKHFTSDKNLPGRDNKFALNAEEFSSMVNNIRTAVSAAIDKGVDYQNIEKDTVNNYRGRWGS